ncbi:phosphoglucosamine mutase [Methanocella sp. CWC-04]|uniref:Phosphoglucosamine mutase n=1 Tax=Methanooceanicella nereidis TaxID=2052831 RepID=A0AAP2RDR0_9EURY|nr:phosphoglucosamine mutase [Methanocella sp. CWC-04]MCD1294921.1 phosphoglucosamine mutase [Methanocella sp. CWC-04]
MVLFGSSGIRGVVNELMTPDLALKAGKALGLTHKSVVIGHDPRTSSQMIENALAAGLQASGSRVTRIGLVSTPTLAYSARNYDCGVMVTASHNPSEYNGLKFWNPDGMAFSLKQQEELESLIYSDIKGVSWRSTGYEVTRHDAIFDHIDAILKDVEKCSLKVVVDCGCGAGSTISPYVLREMGCKVIALNAQPDGFFPARDPEPIEENLHVLKEAVKASGADLGIAHDGDADRMMAVDDRGKFVTGDELLAYFSRFEVKSSLVCPVDASMMVERSAPEARIYKTRIGDAFVSEEVRRMGADFGGETSGTWIFPRISYCPDGIYAAAKLVELVSKNGKLSEAIVSLPRYPLKRGGIKFAHGLDKASIMGGIKAEIDLTKPASINTLDGIRADYDGGWVLVRPSGTEPKIRITAEAENSERAESLYARAESIVKRCIDPCRQ